MNTEFNKLLDYCSANKLTVNFDKTHYIVIKSSRRKKEPICISNITEKDHIKLLGVYIDKSLGWDQQINHISNKISKNIGIIYKTRNYLKLPMLKQLYYTLIYPYLTYGILSWGNAPNTKIKKLLIKQNKCIRAIFFAHKRENAIPYLNLLDILTVDNLFKLKIALFGHTITYKKSLVPSIFHNYLKSVSEIHNYDTRLACNFNFYRPQINTNYGMATLRFSLSKIWETIPTEIKHLSYSNFRNKYKLHLLNNQKQN